MRPRARLASEEQSLGRWTRAARAPDPRLNGVLARPLLGFEQHGASFTSWLEPPRPMLTLMVDLAGALTDDGVPTPDAWVGGSGEKPSIVGFGERYASLDLELTPLGAFRLLGRPLDEIVGGCVPLQDVFGAAGVELAEQLREAGSWDARFDLAEDFLLRRIDAGPAPTPVVAWAFGRLQQSGGRMRIGALAAEAGCSRRHLHALFCQQVGVGPKTAARLLRFHAVRRAVEAAPARWADLAAQAGYSDQAHLTREFRLLAGTTPSEFLARVIPGGGLVGDDLSFVQD